jgi:OOP family OmpA-OmpF porin
MMWRGSGVLLALALAATPLGAQIVLVLPENAEQSATRFAPVASYALPLAAWQQSGPAAPTLEGSVSMTAWRLRNNTETTLQIVQRLRSQIVLAGYELLFECDTEACGGFDFRFALQTLPEPEMHVDLGDFRYLAARRGQGDGAEHLALLVSRSPFAGFVHLVQVGPPGADPAAAEALPPSPPGVFAEPIDVTPLGDENPDAAEQRQVAELTRQFATEGRAVLDDLSFETGAADLSEGNFASLAALAAYLAANPSQRVVLVGHTDAVGSLEGNIALSRRRAEAVRARLIDSLGVAPAQLGAEGAGWLAPRDDNQTEQGRARNRRVEVMLTPT